LIDGSGGPPFLGKQGHVELIYWGKVAKINKGNIDIDKITCLEARDSYRFKDIVKSSTCCLSNRAWNIVAGLIDRKLSTDKTQVVHHYCRADGLVPLG
jgi:hypothetical protein